jgi:Eukaryotic aspartyl protease
VQVVGGGPVIPAAALQAQYLQDAGSNAIVDSGTNSLVLAADVFAAVLNGLKAVNSNFAELFQSTQPVPVSQLTLSAWPNIVFVLEGQAGDVALTVTPQTYWQVDSPSPNVATPVVSGMPAQGPNQSILGLPLMNNYYTVFDRSTGAGIIRFAPISAPS